MICPDESCTWPIRHYHVDYRDERCPGDFVQGHRCVSTPACVDPRPGADRVGLLIMPEPPDLATRVHDRMRASFEADGLTIEGVRAALAAEGVE